MISEKTAPGLGQNKNPTRSATSGSRLAVFYKTGEITLSQNSYAIPTVYNATGEFYEFRKSSL